MTGKTADKLNEEFYQITLPILESFPKFRPPLNFYQFKEGIGVLEPYFYAGNRLSKKKQEELRQLCNEGVIFVSRSDHHIYAEHICNQLDLILQDSNLLEKEKAEIMTKGLIKGITMFYEQPVAVVFEKFRANILVLTEFLWQDRYRIKGLLRRLQRTDGLPSQALNMVFSGLAVYMQSQGEELRRKYLDQMALGLAASLVGLAKIPKFIREKTQNLTPDEQNKLLNYPFTGSNILRKLEVREEMILKCALEHQERMDGSGYPQKLQGREISLAGRIAAIACYFSQAVIQGQKNNQLTPQQIVQVIANQPQKFDTRLARLLVEITRQTFK